MSSNRGHIIQSKLSNNASINQVLLDVIRKHEGQLSLLLNLEKYYCLAYYDYVSVYVYRFEVKKPFKFGMNMLLKYYMSNSIP